MAHSVALQKIRKDLKDIHVTEEVAKSELVLYTHRSLPAATYVDVESIQIEAARTMPSDSLAISAYHEPC